MKNLYTFIVVVLMSAGTFAQVPNTMSYQAIIRNSSDELARKQNIGMQISILQGSFTGSAIFVEQHSKSTNANGLISLKIGEGTPVTGSISSINWSTGLYFIKTQTDLDGGSNYTITGVSQLLSVPYALYANSTGDTKFTDGTKNADDAVYTGGNVGIGTTTPESPLHIVTNTVPALTISSLRTNNPDRPGIMFKNNTSHFISGDGLSDELFGFYSIWSNKRTYDAKLRVYGKTSGSWGKYIEFTHDGTNGSISTDVGDINISPKGDVVVNGDLKVTGKISGTIDIINVSQITGILGQGYTAVFPQVIDNTVVIEIEGVVLHDKVLITSSVGAETERIPVIIGTDDEGNPIYLDKVGYTMEFPIIFETANTEDVQELKDWFDATSPAEHSGSIIITDLSSHETGRWNFYNYIPDKYSAGTDGRTSFTIKYNGLHDNVLSCEYLNDFGSDHSFNPETDMLVEIEGVSTGTFFPAVEVNTEERLITLTTTYNEGWQIYDWVKSTIIGGNTSKSMSVIKVTNDLVETGRSNYFNCIPIKYEHFYGFGLNVKLKARIVISYGYMEVL